MELKKNDSFSKGLSKYQEQFHCNMSVDEIERQCKQYVTRENGVLGCTSCGYVTTVNTHMREHVEKHIEGLTYSCLWCDKIGKSKKNIRTHIFRNHSTK